MTRNTIAFQKGMVVTPEAGIDNRHLAMTVQAELMTFGYMLDQDALHQLGYSDAADIKDFYNEVIDYLKDMTGGKRDYKPIYPGFPQQVMEMSEMQLWINQLVGYLTTGSFIADEWTATKGTAFEQVNYKMIKPGSEQDFKDIFKTLVSSGQSLVPSDMKVIEWFITNYKGLEFPEIIPFKENLCTVLGTLIKLKRPLSTVKLPKLTVTDVLRVIVYMSGGDTSLPAVPRAEIKTGGRYHSNWGPNPAREAFKFKKFTRSERKFILGLLENSNLDTREMKLKDQRWVRIGEIIHPGEFAKEFPRSFHAFDRIRNEKVRSWYGEVDKAFAMSFDVGLAKVSERPGEFLRRLDALIRKNPAKVQNVLNVLAKIGVNSSNKVLFEVYDHFEKRADPTVGRKVMIKGQRKHTKLPELPALPAEIISAVQTTVFDTVKVKFAELPEMGDCWIDPELKKIPLPTNMRSMNDTLVPIIRGQRIPFGTGKKVIRPFIHWFDERGTRDLDLHGFLLGDKKSLNFGFNGEKRGKYGCYSGDVRHRYGPCAEYVDINVDVAVADGYKYFIMVVHNFQGGTLADIKECVSGVMEREFPEANMSWKPDTIANCMKLTQASNMALIAAYDLETREYIHLDMDYNSFSGYMHGGHASSLMEAIAPYIAPPKVSVYDLLQWHVEARGRMVSKETASTHFLFEDFSSSYVKTLEYMGV